MKIYFVRHGETTYNQKYLHQDGMVPLSDHGVKQAKTISRRFRKIIVDVIIASDMKRAEQTAEAINQVIKKKIIYTSLLRELKRPTIIEHKHIADPEAVEIKKQIRQNINDSDWHHSDEENFYDLQKRAEQFLEFLKQRKEENVLVVSHGITIKIIVLTMIYGKLLTPAIFERAMHFMRIANTGIVLCDKTESCNWQLLTWNDYAHLG